ncbi:hypothetical protein [Aquirhabdus sp.]|uniref:hypothetical protein n=1 Tax=Aquirhabdus sp. TaxID=2824160 RepID=UPI00396C5A7E
MTDGEKKKSFWGSFAITDQESCVIAIRNGGIAAIMSAVIMGLFATVGLFTSSTDPSTHYYLDPSLFIDAVLVLIMAFFIFKKSRVASTLLVIYFVLSKILIWQELGKIDGLPLTLVFLFFYINAMRGTYLWHARYKNSLTKEPA